MLWNLYSTFVGLSTFRLSTFLFPQEKTATTEVLQMLNFAEEVPEENLRADLSARLDGDVLHREVIRANFEEFQLEPLVYSPLFAVAWSNLTLGQGKYTTQQIQCPALSQFNPSYQTNNVADM